MRTTITINDKLYKTLKLQAVQSGESMSKLVENAIKRQLLEDIEDLQAVKEAENEPTIDYDQFVAELKADGLL